MIDIVVGIVIAWVVIQLIELLLRSFEQVFPRTFEVAFNALMVVLIFGLVAATGYGIWKMIIYLK